MQTIFIKILRSKLETLQRKKTWVESIREKTIKKKLNPYHVGLFTNSMNKIGFPNSKHD